MYRHAKINGFRQNSMGSGWVLQHFWCFLTTNLNKFDLGLKAHLRFFSEVDGLFRGFGPWKGALCF